MQFDKREVKNGVRLSEIAELFGCLEKQKWRETREFFVLAKLVMESFLPLDPLKEARLYLLFDKYLEAVGRVPSRLSQLQIASSLQLVNLKLEPSYEGGLSSSYSIHLAFQKVLGLERTQILGVLKKHKKRIQAVWDQNQWVEVLCEEIQYPFPTEIVKAVKSGDRNHYQLQFLKQFENFFFSKRKVSKKVEKLLFLLTKARSKLHLINEAENVLGVYLGKSCALENIDQIWLHCMEQIHQTTYKRRKLK